MLTGFEQRVSVLFTREMFSMQYVFNIASISLTLSILVSVYALSRLHSPRTEHPSKKKTCSSGNNDIVSEISFPSPSPMAHDGQLLLSPGARISAESLPELPLLYPANDTPVMPPDDRPAPPRTGCQMPSAIICQRDAGRWIIVRWRNWANIGMLFGSAGHGTLHPLDGMKSTIYP